MFTKVKDFFKKETVCCIAFLLAVVSMFFIPPSVNYFFYIDFRVLALLFSLMAVVIKCTPCQGQFKKKGFLDVI